MKESITYGDLELEVMSQLWDADRPLSVTEVHHRLNATRELAYTTVMTVLSNLYKKSAVDRAKQGKAFLYWAVQKRDEAAAGFFQNLLQKVYRNSPADLVAGFLKTNAPLSAKEVEQLREELQRIENNFD